MPSCFRATFDSHVTLVDEAMADEKDVPEKTISEDLVVTKYKMAGDIVNREFQLCKLRPSSVL